MSAHCPLYPTSPSLPWVAWVSLPHFPRYYATLRLPPCPSRVASLVARVPIPCLFLCVRGVPLGLVVWSKLPNHARAFDHPVPQSGYVVKETGGSPTFPSSPSEDMPRSQTPVVSCALAKAHPGLLPSSHWKPSAFPLVSPGGLSCCPRRYSFRGSITRPAASFHPAPYAHCWVCTWMSLLTCWLGFDQVGLELALSPTG